LARDGNFSGFGNSIWDFPIFPPSEGIPIPRERGTRTGPYNLDFWEREYPFPNPIRWESHPKCLGMGWDSHGISLSLTDLNGPIITCGAVVVALFYPQSYVYRKVVQYKGRLNTSEHDALQVASFRPDLTLLSRQRTVRTN
jgi:hypothetical protein